MSGSHALSSADAPVRSTPSRPRDVQGDVPQTPLLVELADAELEHVAGGLERVWWPAAWSAGGDD